MATVGHNGNDIYSMPHILTGPNIQGQQPPYNMADLLEPAIDGPPSPERIRQLSKQMKHASHLNLGSGHRSASSSSSVVGERSTWDDSSLSRRSSNRSRATSGSPQPDRSDLALSKNIFHRRAKSSKSGLDLSAHGSSTSLSSAESAIKDSRVSNVFSRRKPSRDELTQHKKLLISEPFNFQHVSHTPREQVMSLDQEPGSVVAKLHISQPLLADQFHTRPAAALRQSVRPPKPNRLIKHTRSQEQLRTNPPPRPPRSPPMEPIGNAVVPPVPPPRISSRQSSRRESMVWSALNRPQTSGGFRTPQPFAPQETLEEPPATSYGYVSAVEESDDLVEDDHRFSHAITTPDDAAWPLAPVGSPQFERALADVPEEDEHAALRRSRLSIASSLRASQSVPMLRGVPESRRTSQTSDTLGGSDITAQHKDDFDDFAAQTASNRESWEDDIDYCYEHEADANFDYEWERPSMDVPRAYMPPPVQIDDMDDELRESPAVGSAQSPPAALSPSQPDVPDLSPSSLTSGAAAQEIFPPASAAPVTSNFSLPRGERRLRPPSLKHIRSDSRASSFKESHGFTLSPSLLIPGDYHHQLMLSETSANEEEQQQQQSNLAGPMALYGDNDSSTNLASSFLLQQRASVSTTATNSTSISDSTGERHVSANSTWTSLTRLTSSTSLNKISGSWLEAGDRITEAHSAAPSEDGIDQDTTPPATKDGDIVPELSDFPLAPVGKRVYHKTHASESQVHDEVPPMKSPDLSKTRRSRARASSLNTHNAQAPPVGQYALFPRSQVRGNSDRI